MGHQPPRGSLDGVMAHSLVNMVGRAKINDSTH
jgi:hypothetical protein